MSPREQGVSHGVSHTHGHSVSSSTAPTYPSQNLQESPAVEHRVEVEELVVEPREEAGPNQIHSELPAATLELYEEGRASELCEEVSAALNNHPMHAHWSAFQLPRKNQFQLTPAGIRPTPMSTLVLVLVPRQVNSYPVRHCWRHGPCYILPSSWWRDDDMINRVADFGLAELLSSNTGNMGGDQTSSPGNLNLQKWRLTD
ncbi:hypothetical protein V6N13_038476 [Hibiscus sabdariffa]